MNRRFVGLLVVALATVLWPSAVRAQPRRDGAIAACGSESVRVQPTLLRLEVHLRVNGATAERAVEQLKTQRKAAIAKLKDLKAEEGSIRFTNTVLTRNTNWGYAPGAIYYPTPAGSPPAGYGPAPSLVPPPGSAPAIGPTYHPSDAPELTPPSLAPTAAPSSSSSPDEPARPVIEVAPSESTPPATISPVLTPSPALTPFLPGAEPRVTFQPGTYPPSPSAGSFVAATTLRAEWRLPTSDADGIALAGESLRAKLAAARVFGECDSHYPVPTGAAPTYTYSPPGGYPTPASSVVMNSGFTLSFVGTLSDAQRKAALAVATAKARQRAAELAEIAVGRIDDLSSAESDINHATTGEHPFDPTTDIVSFPRADRSEVVSQSPDLPEFTINVILKYRFLGKTPTNP